MSAHESAEPTWGVLPSCAMRTVAARTARARVSSAATSSVPAIRPVESIPSAREGEDSEAAGAQAHEKGPPAATLGDPARITALPHPVDGAGDPVAERGGRVPAEQAAALGAVGDPGLAVPDARRHRAPVALYLRTRLAQHGVDHLRERA